LDGDHLYFVSSAGDLAAPFWRRGMMPDFVQSGWAAALQATLLLAGILWVCGRVGSACFKLLGRAALGFTALEELLFSIGAGLSVLSGTIFLLGMFGRLRHSWFVGDLVGLGIGALIILGWSEFWRIPAVFYHKIDRRGWVFAALVLGVLFLAWVQAVSPPIGNDALAYHLFHPKEFLRQGNLGPIPYARESLWPYLTETLFMLGLSLSGTALAQLFHWAFYVMTAALSGAFCLRFFDRRTAEAAVLIFLFTPAAFAQAGTAYVDHALAFYCFSSIYVYALFVQNPRLPLLLVSGYLGGAAMAVKYLGIGVVAILALLETFRHRCRVIANSLLIVSAAFCACGFWYLRSWSVTGNPVFPFFPRIFGGHGATFDIAAGAGMGKGFLAFLTLGWNMTLHPSFFGGEILGPVFLMLVPAAALFSRLRMRRPLTAAVAFGIIYLIFLFTQSQQTRFYLSVIPLLAVASAYALIRLWREGQAGIRAVIAVLMAACLLLHGGMFVHRTRALWPVLLGRVTAERYLEIHERSFDGLQYLGRHLQAGQTWFNANEPRLFYASSTRGMIEDSLLLREEFRRTKSGLYDHLSVKSYDYIWISDDVDPEVSRYLVDHQTSYARVYDYDFTENPRTYHFAVYQKRAQLSSPAALSK
jgi:hypothetical protein